jgi:hypothetical protein
MKDLSNVALIDMDGTIADFDQAMEHSLELLRAPEEEIYKTGLHKKHPKHIVNRMDLIRAQGDWWENLPKIESGFKIIEILKNIGFYMTILSQGPKDNPISWSHKVRWCKKNVPELDITITRNKGLIYGKLLFDDYPPYITEWLKHRPRGIVIMPKQLWNIDFVHTNVYVYDNNIDFITKIIKAVKNRKPGDDIQL